MHVIVDAEENNNAEFLKEQQEGDMNTVTKVCVHFFSTVGSCVLIVDSFIILPSQTVPLDAKPGDQGHLHLHLRLVGELRRDRLDVDSDEEKVTPLQIIVLISVCCVLRITVLM